MPDLERLQQQPGAHPASPPTQPAGEPEGLSRAGARFVLGTACATCALIVLDTNVVAVSLPSIARTFHAGFADIEWVVSAYMVTFAACLLAAGGLADRFGRKKMLLVGLAVFFL